MSFVSNHRNHTAATMHVHGVRLLFLSKLSEQSSINTRLDYRDMYHSLFCQHYNQLCNEASKLVNDQPNFMNLQYQAVLYTHRCPTVVSTQVYASYLAIIVRTLPFLASSKVILGCSLRSRY